MNPSSGCVVCSLWDKFVADGKGYKYSQETATMFARELLKDAKESTVIAVVSAPSVFVELKNYLVSLSPSSRPCGWLTF